MVQAQDKLDERQLHMIDEVINKGYDRAAFSNFMNSKKGLDYTQYNIAEVKQVSISHLLRLN